MVVRMKLTYREFTDILDAKYIARSSTGYTHAPRLKETCDPNLILKSVLPNDGKMKITIDHIGLISNIKPNDY